MSRFNYPELRIDVETDYILPFFLNFTGDWLKFYMKISPNAQFLGIKWVRLSKVTDSQSDIDFQPLIVLRLNFYLIEYDCHLQNFSIQCYQNDHK